MKVLISLLRVIVALLVGLGSIAFVNGGGNIGFGQGVLGVIAIMPSFYPPHGSLISEVSEEKLWISLSVGTASAIAFFITMI